MQRREFMKALAGVPILSISAGLPFRSSGALAQPNPMKRLVRCFDLPANPGELSVLRAIHPHGGAAFVPGYDYDALAWTKTAPLTMRREDDTFIIEDDRSSRYVCIPMPQRRVTIYAITYRAGGPFLWHQTWNFSLGGRDGA